MSKFYSIGGMSPTGGEGEQGVTKSDGPQEIADLVHGWYGEEVAANPRVQEFLKARGDTSHDVITEVGEKFHYKREGVGGVVLHEEKDSHTGRIEQTVQVSSQTDSGTRKLTWEPSGPRTMVQVDDKRGD